MSAPFTLPPKIQRSGLTPYLPDVVDAVGFDARDLLKLEVDDIRYRWSLLDRFDRLPRDATTFELDDTSLATLEATGEVAIYANKNWMIAGTNSSNDDATYTVEGGIRIETDGAAADQVLITPQTETGFVGPLATIDWDPRQQMSVTAVIKRDSADVDYIFVVGFSDTVDVDPTAATEAALVEFTVSAAGAISAKFRTAIAGTDADEAFTVNNTSWAVSKVRKISLVLDSQRKGHVFFDDVEVLTSTKQLTATATFLPLVGIEAVGAAACAMDVYAIKVSQNYLV